MIKLQGRSRIINGDETLEVFRDGEIEWIKGKATRIGGRTFLIRANIQPVDGRDLLLVPEADRYKEQYFLFTETQLAVNDRVTRGGVLFQLQNVQYWGTFCECKMMRIDVGPDSVGQ